MLTAITRAVSPRLAECQLTHRAREPIDVDAAVAEHACYEQALRSLGVTVVRAPATPHLPDGVFVEDTAIVLDEVAILTRPGAESRRAEVDSIAATVAKYRQVACVEAPATLDGGDVLLVGRTLYVGISTRTNPEAVSQLGALLAPWNYRVVGVAFEGCLHLKSAVSVIGAQTLLINPDFVEPETFPGVQTVAVAPEEPDAANALLVGTTVIYPEHHPRTAERLEHAGVRVARVVCAELARAEAGVTCCSLLFNAEVA